MTRGLSRRLFIAQTAGAAAAPLIQAPAQAPLDDGTLIDVNIHLSSWPFRSLLSTPDLTVLLRKHQVQQAWAGSFDALLHRDLASVNARLAQDCKTHGPDLFLPVGSINPTLPSWQDDVKRCAQQHGMKILRLYPGYHGYTLNDPIFNELLQLATANQMLVQIVAQLEDQRTQHLLVQAKPVNLKPLASALEQIPTARVMVLNASATMVLTTLQGCKNVWMDFAMIEGVGGIEALLKSWPLEKLCFGSHAPFFYWHSSLLKLQESALSETDLKAIRLRNAQALA